MKVVIFAGGMGSRISEESHLKPKPMIEIGDKPILWHIMKFYSSDGFTDLNLKELVRFHKEHGKVATVTAIQPEGRFGGMELSEDNTVHEFIEKPRGDGRWINAGYFVMKPEIFRYLDERADRIMWE